MKGQSRSSLIQKKHSKTEWTVAGAAVRALRDSGTRRNVEGMALLRRKST